MKKKKAKSKDTRQQEDVKDRGTVVEEQESERDELKSKCEEYLNLARRAQADFSNYQERMKKEKESYVKYSVEGFARELLSVLDGLQKSIDLSVEDPDVMSEGLEIVKKDFLKVLQRHGVHKIEATAQPFDPHFHEAVMMGESDTVEPNTVIEVLRDGYTIHDRVLRPVQVRVSAPA